MSLTFNTCEFIREIKVKMKNIFNKKSRPILKQYIIVIIANFTLMHMGLCTAWMSPVLVKLRDANQTVLPDPITENEGAWMVSIGSLVGVTAMSFTGLLANHLGRKTTLIISCLPRIAMSFLFIFASRVWMLYLGRCLCGISDFMAMSVTATYSSEIASKEVRGALGTLSQILSAIGAMIMLSIGPFLPYVTLNIFLTCIIIATFVPILFIPESPCFLHSKGRTEDTVKVLKFLRGTNNEVHEEITEYNLSDDTKIKAKDILSDKVVIKTFCKVIVLAVGVQLIGYNAVSIYLQTILILTNTSVKPEISSVIIGCVELLACFCTILLTDRFGRKPILSTSLVGTAVGMVGLGTFFTLTEEGADVVGYLNYFPLASIILVVYFYNSGMGSLLWMQLAELFDGRFRAFGVSTGVFFSSTFVFLTLRFFPAVTNAIGPASTYWMFAAFCLLLCAYILFFIPETKGRSFVDIQKALGRKDLKPSSKVFERSVVRTVEEMFTTSSAGLNKGTDLNSTIHVTEHDNNYNNNIK